MGKQIKNHTSEDDPDKDYLGNIWGWKFSYIGLGIILFFLTFAIIRSMMLGVPLTPQKDANTIESTK